MNRTTIQIDLDKYAQNLNTIKALIGPKVSILAVVKDNAYGLGAIELAHQAIQNGCRYLGVASIQEAINLRTHGLSAPILILSEPSFESVKHLIRYDLTQTIVTTSFAKHLDKAATKAGKKAKIHLKIDTGMGRIGPLSENAFEFIEKIIGLNSLDIEGIYTHPSDSENPTSDHVPRQLERFKNVLAQLKAHSIKFKLTHMANSGATFYFPQTRFDMVRIGLAGYENIISMTSHVNYIKEVPANTPISYKNMYVTSDKTTIAVISAGYGDGYPIELSNMGQVEINGTFYPVRGTVCMDLIIIDLGKNPHNVAIGDPVTLISSDAKKPNCMTQISKITGRNPRELTCRLNGNPSKVYSQTKTNAPHSQAN